RRPGRPADGRWRRSCRGASLEPDAAEPLGQVTTNRVHIRAAREAAAAPGAGARGERLELVRLRGLSERAAYGTPDELRARRARCACHAVEKLELVTSEVDLRPAHGVIIHH